MIYIEKRAVSPYWWGYTVDTWMSCDGCTYKMIPRFFDHRSGTERQQRLFERSSEVSMMSVESRLYVCLCTALNGIQRDLDSIRDHSGVPGRRQHAMGPPCNTP